jgi:hypothetical protein
MPAIALTNLYNAAESELVAAVLEILLGETRFVRRRLLPAFDRRLQPSSRTTDSAMQASSAPRPRP